MRALVWIPRTIPHVHTRINSFLSSIYPTKEGFIVIGGQHVGGLKITRQVFLPDSAVDFTDINYS